MRGLHVGTSGWTYDDWTGRFYPEDVRGTDRLAFYVSRFDSVEINATYYRFPTAAMIASWNRRLPGRFHLVVKGHRRVTHLGRLRPEADDSLRGFLERIAPLRTLRVVLWQVPPSMTCDPGLLDAFLERVERHASACWPHRHRLRHAFEPRHPSWWDSGEAARVLRRHRAALVAVSHPKLPDTIVPTADFLYVRFHGTGPRLYDYDYSDAELRRWARRLAPLLGNRALYAFFNNDWRACAPRNAARFRELLDDVLVARGAG